MTPIQNQIAQTATRLGLTLDPRHVEGWMRYDHDVLSHLPEEAFEAYCVRVADADEAWQMQLEAMAQIEGL